VNATTPFLINHRMHQRGNRARALMLLLFTISSRSRTPTRVGADRRGLARDRSRAFHTRNPLLPQPSRSIVEPRVIVRKGQCEYRIRRVTRYIMVIRSIMLLYAARLTFREYCPTCLDSRFLAISIAITDLVE